MLHMMMMLTMKLIRMKMLMMVRRTTVTRKTMFFMVSTQSVIEQGARSPLTCPPRICPERV